jgi:hypothetical protein
MRAVGHATPQTVCDRINRGDPPQRRDRHGLKTLGRVKHGDMPPTAEG